MRVFIENFGVKRTVSLAERALSKDKFYSYALSLEQSQEIYFVPYFEKPKAIKKIFAYNPALFGAVCFDKKFHNTLSNYIFLV